MKKDLLVLSVTLAALTSTSIALAFNFQELDDKVLNGEITHEQAKQIVDKAVEKGEITKDQLRQHMEQMRKNSPKQGMRPLVPPPGHRGPGGDEFIKKLKEAGITKDQFEAAHKKGPDAVRKLLESHKIQPPCPGKPPEFRNKEVKDEN